MLTGPTINVRSIRNRDLDTLLDLLSDIENQGEFLPETMMSEPAFRQRYEHNGPEPGCFQRNCGGSGNPRQRRISLLLAPKCHFSITPKPAHRYSS